MAEGRSIGRTLTLVVPVFNEEERGSESLDALIDFIDARPVGSKLIFADDGSTDRTVEVLRAGIARRGTDRASVLECPHAGKGSALRAGFAQADTLLAAFCDVDLATPLDELSRIIDVASAGGCLAIGSRATQDAHLEHHEARRREIAGRAFNRLVRTFLCPGVADTQCGAKAAPTAVWRRLAQSSRQTGFAWDVEIIALALRNGIEVQELGITWNHDERTRVRVARDGLLMVLAVPQIGLSVLRSRRLDVALLDAEVPAGRDSAVANPL